MDSVIRAAVIYFVLLLVFRLGGNRSIAQITAFDFILLLIISEAIQQAMITEDYSLTNAFLLVVTLVGLDIMMSLWKQRSRRVDRILDGVPILDRCFHSDIMITSPDRKSTRLNSSH